jgi:hypothetical protein
VLYNDEYLNIHEKALSHFTGKKTYNQWVTQIVLHK